MTYEVYGCGEMRKKDKKYTPLVANSPGWLYCIECGNKIEGEPYETSLAAYEDSVDPVQFCSKVCWDGSEEFNTANWP